MTTETRSSRPTSTRRCSAPPPTAASVNSDCRPQEERFEKGRRTVGLFLAPLLTVVFLVLPIDIPREQQVLAAVLLGVIALWISEAVPIPIGGLLGVAVAVFLGVAPVDDVLGAVRVVDDLHVHRGVHPGAGDAQARRRAAVRVLDPRPAGGGQVHHRRDPRVRRDHLPAVGVRLQHRDGGDAAADGDRHHQRHRQAAAGAAATSNRTSIPNACGSAPRSC